MSSSKAIATSRAAIVVFAIVASLLVVATAPAAAGTQNTVVSRHTTDSDFNSGSLSNVSVVGSGEDASLFYQSNNTTTFGYTGSDQTWTVPSGVTEIRVELSGAQGGRNGGLGGFVEGNASVTPGDVLTVKVGGQGSTGANSGGWPNGGDGAHAESERFANADSGGGGGRSEIRTSGGTTIAVAGGGGGRGDASASNSNGPDCEVVGEGGDGGPDTGEDGEDTTDQDCGQDTVQGGDGGTQSSGGSAGSGGNAASNPTAGSKFQGGGGVGEGNNAGDNEQDQAAAGGGGGDGWYGGGGADALATDFGDGWSTAHGPGGGAGSNYDDGLDTVRANQRGINDGNGQVVISYDRGGEYISANHTAEDSFEGVVNITSIDNASVDVLWETSDGSGWSTLNDSDGVTTAGEHTFTWSQESNSTVRLNLTFIDESTGFEPGTVEVSEEYVKGPAHEPVLNNSTASPTGILTTATPTLSIDANDTDFSLPKGDSLDVEFFVDGSSVGTDTLSNNGTASVTASITTGGDHTWNATVTDAYGLTNTSSDFTITVPNTLSIRTEREPHSLITNSEAAIIYERTNDDPVIVNRSDADNDGNISLSNLPVTEDFVVSITAPGYHNRTILIESIYDQQSAFLLSTSVPSVETRFLVDDRTGDFDPPETQLVVQRAINRSIYGETPAGYSWTSIAGDDLGADSAFVVDLEEERRYRIAIQNNAGDTRILGSHVAQTTGTHTLKVGQISWAVREDQRFNWTFVKDPDATPDPYVRFTYRDLDDNTTDIDGVIFEVGNRSNVLTTFSGSGPYGQFAFTQTLTSAQAETDWQVEFNATRDGEQFSSTGVTGLEQLNSGIPLVLAINTLSPSWQDALAGAAILITSFVFTGLFSAVGGLLVAAVGSILWMVGGAPWSLAAVILALVIGVVYRLSDRTGGL